MLLNNETRLQDLPVDYYQNEQRDLRVFIHNLWRSGRLTQDNVYLLCKYSYDVGYEDGSVE